MSASGSFPILDRLTPEKRRALVGSFVLGVLVMAFFASVLAILPGLPDAGRSKRPERPKPEPAPLVSAASAPAARPN